MTELSPNLPEPYPVDLSVDGLSISLLMNRPVDQSDKPNIELISLAANGLQVIEPFTDQLSHSELLEEIAALGRVETAAYAIVGLITSDNGFARSAHPFDSLSDPTMRDGFRAITDELASSPSSGARPLDLARRALPRLIEYDEDGSTLPWDRELVYDHLTAAFAETGRIFDDFEHIDKSVARYDWPASAARLARRAFDIGQGTADPRNEFVHERLVNDFTHVSAHSRLSPAEITALAEQMDALAGTHILSVADVPLESYTDM